VIWKHAPRKRNAHLADQKVETAFDFNNPYRFTVWMLLDWLGLFLEAFQPSRCHDFKVNMRR
jgi:hypothetical protein